MRRRAMGALAFGAAAAGSAAIGYAAKRRAVAGVEPARGDEWAELHRPVHGERLAIRSYDGTRLHAEVLGPEAAPTVVLVHGYGLSQHAWHYQRRDLRDRFRLVCYDQRGHGGSALAATGDYSMATLGRDLAAVLDVAAPAGQPLVLVGHSMGGMTLLSFAEQLPERVPDLAGVVLASTAGGGVVAGGAFTAGAAALSTLRGQALRRRRREPGGPPDDDPSAWTGPPRADTLFLLTRALGFSPEADPAHVAFTEQLLAQAPGRVVAALGPALTSLRLIDAAEHLDVPGMVLVGDHDRLTPVRQARRLAERLPKAELQVIEGAGHMLPLEAHARVTEELRAFVDAVAG